MLTIVDKLHKAMGVPEEDAARWRPFILEVGLKYGLLTTRRLAMFVAQAGHESMGFRKLTENLNYSAAALHRTWPKRFPTLADAEPYALQPEKIANKVYGGRMGNGPEATGDGWRYRGRGLFQLTGHDNYLACGTALGTNFILQPELLATDHYAALSAGWFWDSRHLNPLADAGDVEAVTRRINGGTNGLAERKVLYDRALGAFQS